MATKRTTILGTLGDVNWLDYDAGVVFTDKDGVYMEFWRWDNESDESSKAICQVYRTDVPDDVWAEYNWVKVEALAHTIGMDPKEMRDFGVSANVMDRAGMVEEIASYHGPQNIDSDPLTLTRSELKKRWGRRLK